MAIYLEQEASEVEASFATQRRAEILGLRLLSASLKSNPKLEGLSYPLELEVGFRVVSTEVQGRTLAVTIDFTLSATDSSRPPLRAYRIRCAIQASYELEAEFEPTQAQLSAFAGANVIFNAWPYFREFAHSSAQRLGLLEAPVIPFLKMIPKLPAAATPSSD